MVPRRLNFTFTPRIGNFTPQKHIDYEAKTACRYDDLFSLANERDIQRFCLLIVRIKNDYIMDHMVT